MPAVPACPIYPVSTVTLGFSSQCTMLELMGVSELYPCCGGDQQVHPPAAQPDTELLHIQIWGHMLSPVCGQVQAPTDL